MTHNSRDWEADFDTLFEWTDFDGQIGSFVLVKTKSDYAIEETERNELKAFIHQELQKAREEERERIGNLMLTQLDKSTKIKALKSISGSFRAMIIKAITQSELDQPT